jgi:hypothetical protein
MLNCIAFNEMIIRGGGQSICFKLVRQCLSSVVKSAIVLVCDSFSLRDISPHGSRLMTSPQDVIILHYYKMNPIVRTN